MITSSKIVVRKYFLSSLRKAWAPDGAEAPVGEVVHKVDVKVDDVEVDEVEVDEVEDEAEAHVDEVDPDVHVRCDLPMSIYSKYFPSLFVSKLLRSKFSGQFFKLVKD